MDETVKRFVDVFQSEDHFKNAPRESLFDGDFFDKLHSLYDCSVIAAYGDCSACPFFDKEKILIDDDCRTVAMAWASLEILRLRKEISKLGKQTK